MIIAAFAAVALPQPRHDGALSLERALAERRTTREFAAAPLRLADLAQLAWAAQGAVTPEGRRTAPSAGALYPLELYLVVARVEDLAPGIYHYEPAHHRLVPTVEGDRVAALARAAIGQRWIEEAAAVLVITAVHKRTTAKYGRRGERYVHIEAGHAAQNVLLQAAALRLAAAPVGAFDDHGVQAALALPAEAEPLYLIPVGRARVSGGR